MKTIDERSTSVIISFASHIPSLLPSPTVSLFFITIATFTITLAITTTITTMMIIKEVVDKCGLANAVAIQSASCRRGSPADCIKCS